MKLTIPLLFVAVTVVSAMPRGPQGPPMQGINPAIMGDPAMRKAIIDMIMQHMQQGMGGFKPKPPQQRFPPQPNFNNNWHQPRPAPNFHMPPGNVFFNNNRPPPGPVMGPRQPMQPRHQPAPARPAAPAAPKNTGPLMDIQGGGGYGAGAGAAAGGYAASMSFGGSYCPPGAAAFATGSDNCKDKIIYEALYNKTTGKPLYSWVPPAQPWDPYSIPDNVKDQAMHILIQKVMSSPTKKATPKQKDLMRALGDPPNHVKPMFGIYM